MRSPSSSFIALALLLGAAACASPSDDAGSNEADWTSGTASKKLSSELFADADPKQDDPWDYVLLGTLPNSTEKCAVTIHRRGLTPGQNDWSTVEIHPFGRSAKTVEKHGPVDIGWAMSPDASSSGETIKVTGDELVYKRIPRGQSDENMTLTAHFAAGKKHQFDTLTDAAIAGTNVNGKESASCEKLTPLITVKWSEVEPITKKAFDDWERDNSDDTEMDFEGCTVSSPTRVACDYGNDTNEEQLGLTFAIDKGKLGKMVHANRHSDFN